MKKSEIAMLCFFLLLCFIVALMGSVWTEESVKTWYVTLNKPSWTPPSFVFPIAWTILYTLMAVAAWMVAINEGDPHKKKVAFIAFGVQLFLNLIWSYLFFSLRSPSLAFIDIVLLEIAILATIWAFYRVRPLAGWLLVPYMLWVTFALCLNGAIVLANRQS